MPIPGQPGAPPAPAPDAAEASTGPGAGGPMPSPITTPQPMAGLEKSSRVKMQVFAKAISAEVANFPFGSKEQKALIDILKKLADTFGKSAEEDQGLMKSETMTMLGSLGKQTPGQAAMGAKPPGMPPPGGPPAAPVPQGA